MSAPDIVAERRFGVDGVGVMLLLIVALTAARFVLAPFIPLAFDEAYYWRWSEHLALGYFDHPPMVAWLARAGTTIAGDTLFGVRLFFLLGGILASWAVWRAVELLFGDRRLAAVATLFFNITLIVSVGTILATPDAPLLVAAALLLYCLAKVVASDGKPVWWIAAGIVAGLGLLSKYTAFFWLPGVLLWLIIDPRMRRQLRTPWPWLAAGTALLVFLPNLLWNAAHGWMTFYKQFGRVDDGAFGFRYFFEHLGTEIGMATPILFLLGWMAFARFFSRSSGVSLTVRALLGVFVWPMTLYFIYHSLHARVEGNWTGPIFPAFAVAAALAAWRVDWPGAWQAVVRWLRLLAAPVGIVVVVAIYLQSAFGFLPLGSWDPTASRMGEGIPEIAAQVDAIRRDQGATLILTTSYMTTGWLSFYSPTRPAPVEQFNERERWIQESPVPENLLAGPLLVVVPEGESVAAVEAQYGRAEQVASLDRMRGSLRVGGYDVYLLRRSVLARAGRQARPAGRRRKCGCRV